ncbi:MAG TPA: amidohydrolase family protein [Acidobacteriaceae bacterium]|nr:amidohydrolase family protein [Acidobacteriaceae bacterium]
MRLFFVGALTFLAVAMAAPVAGAADLPAATYVHAGKLLDVRSGKMLSDQVIVIRGDRIERVVANGGVLIPAGSATVDLTRATVLPGLIDCHTHILLTDTDNSHYDDILLKQSWQYRTILATLNVKRDLEAGFTSMRDVETEGAMYSDVDVRNAINQGLIPGPRLKVATRGISTTGGYGLEGYSPEVTVPIGVQTIDSPSEARKAVREQFNYGADLIKIYGTDRYSFLPDGKEVSVADFSLEEVQAIVDEARLKGLKVACHAYDGPGLHYCIDAGVASIEHGIQLDDDAIRKMVAKGIYLVPTLYVYCCALEKGDLAMSGGKTSRLAIHEVSFKKALAAGVKIAFGTDAGSFPHGTQAIEFEWMTRYGMSPLQAIQAATISAADLMGWGDQIGAIEPGKFADVIAVDENPLDDIKQLEHVRFVMKGGTVVRNDYGK